MKHGCSASRSVVVAEWLWPAAQEGEEMADSKARLNGNGDGFPPTGKRWARAHSNTQLGLSILMDWRWRMEDTKSKVREDQIEGVSKKSKGRGDRSKIQEDPQ